MSSPMVGSINNPEGHEARKSKAKFRQWKSDEFSTAGHRAKNHSTDKDISFLLSAFITRIVIYFLIMSLFNERLI